MSLGISRREATTPACAGACAAAPTAEVRHTPTQETAGKVIEAAYAAGAIGGVVVAGAALVAVTGLIATGIIDHHQGTQLSSVFVNNASAFETLMKGGTIFVGACASIMVAGLGVFGLSALAQRVSRKSA